ncbi:hypothetical protein cym2001_24320 [Pseudomonas sp. CYM-20-01]|uniref:hypothetical protein n=1 Tax=Pseudomonas sp. CYM-20-01 TaxID=2870750 RepID=UPI002070F9ED|nr:hypothetical protein [Pseudomonas sp. CYM-20-01]BDB19067.1 hypothetical protein cym2001_24320 [Pseudomonas sp. CYM-20-01]
MNCSIDLFADAIESKAHEILKNAHQLEQHGHDRLARNVIEQARTLLTALEELRRLSREPVCTT